MNRQKNFDLYFLAYPLLMMLSGALQCLGTLFALYENNIEIVISGYYAVCKS
jgi:hypothetical protein